MEDITACVIILVKKIFKKMKLAKRELKDFGNDVMRKVEQLIISNPQEPLVIYLEGGHYNPSHGINEFSVNSLIFSLDIANNLIAEFKEKIKIVLGILINNLGQVCGDTFCSKDSSEQSISDLPSEYHNIFKEYRIVKTDRIIISNEINAKNRAVKYLKNNLDNYIDNSLIEIEDQDQLKKIFYSHDRNRFLLAETDYKKWIAKCPSIMGQHYADILLTLHKRYPKYKQNLIVDFSEAYDFHKVISGSEAGLNLFLKQELCLKEIEIMNVFLWDDSGERYSTENKRNLLNTVNVI